MPLLSPPPDEAATERRPSCRMASAPQGTKSGRNTPRCPGTKPAMDGCSSTRGPDEICKKHPALAGRLSTADHPSDRALPASRLTASSSGKRGDRALDESGSAFTVIDISEGGARLESNGDVNTPRLFQRSFRI